MLTPVSVLHVAAAVRSIVGSSSMAAGHKRRVDDAASAAAGPAGDVRVKRERGAGAEVAFVDMCRVSHVGGRASENI
jgi:hypothetical protein